VTQRRFSGVTRLYGDTAAQALQQSHVLIAGIGGVGSWAAEALARSGVGHLSLVDLDVVAESNINRQIHALRGTLGANKVDVMKQRIEQINADCQVKVVDDFVTLENMPSILSANPDFVIDAIDSPRVKAALIHYCQSHQIGISVAGAAGGRDDPLALTRQDLALTKGDAFLANVRSRLRRDYGYTRALGVCFGVNAIVSTQLALQSGAGAHQGNGAPLACAGYGSIVTVTAAMGMALASIALQQLIKSNSVTTTV
jgi:tRNA threonylcarbamoyladenosine dehydratase